MNTRQLDLKKLGPRFRVEDAMILALVKHRMGISLQVGSRKLQTGESIINLGRENDRINAARRWGKKNGLNPHFATELLYSIIDESCKLQTVQLQEFQESQKSWTNQDRSLATKEPSDDEWYSQLKENLLILTKRWCGSYDRGYSKHGFATKAYLDFEKTLIKREIGQLVNCGTLLDLGCATGRMTFPLSRHFERSIGYDISPHMVSVAQERLKSHPQGSKTSFNEIDVENGIPVDDASMSFVLMNFGTASDVKNIRGVISETMRVLESGGRFLFSFYNRDALLYRWEFLPWSVGLVASIDLERNCLEVWSRDKEHSRDEKLPIYARAYTPSDIEGFFREVGAVVCLSTYPTVSSILPDILLNGQTGIRDAVKEIDTTLSVSSMGAYIIATGQK